MNLAKKSRLGGGDTLCEALRSDIYRKMGRRMPSGGHLGHDVYLGIYDIYVGNKFPE
jgi:hypothetical protein